MYQVPKKNLDELLHEIKDCAATEHVSVPAQFLRDIVAEVKKLRHKVSKPRKVVKNEKN